VANTRLAVADARSAKKLIDSVHAKVGSRTIAELEAERDEILPQPSKKVIQ
jgi:hypothetical protein